MSLFRLSIGPKRTSNIAAAASGLQLVRDFRRTRVYKIYVIAIAGAGRLLKDQKSIYHDNVYHTFEKGRE